MESRCLALQQHALSLFPPLYIVDTVEVVSIVCEILCGRANLEQ